MEDELYLTKEQLDEVLKVHEFGRRWNKMQHFQRLKAEQILDSLSREVGK